MEMSDFEFRISDLPNQAKDEVAAATEDLGMFLFIGSSGNNRELHSDVKFRRGRFNHHTISQSNTIHSLIEFRSFGR